MEGGRVVDESSLARTVDAVEETLESGVSPTGAEKASLENWLIGRQIRSGRNAGAFCPTDFDYADGVRLFTGERLRTRLATRNVLTAEATRLLIHLGGGNAQVDAAISRAWGWLDIACFAARGCALGECAHSASAYLRLVAASRSDPIRLAQCVSGVREHRDGTGRWRQFPFYYTLLALAEVSTQAARDELRYALPALERVRNRRARDAIYDVRRKRLVERAFALVDDRLL